VQPTISHKELLLCPECRSTAALRVAGSRSIKPMKPPANFACQLQADHACDAPTSVLRQHAIMHRDTQTHTCRQAHVAGNVGCVHSALHRSLVCPLDAASMHLHTTSNNPHTTSNNPIRSTHMRIRLHTAKPRPEHTIKVLQARDLHTARCGLVCTHRCVRAHGVCMSVQESSVDSHTQHSRHSMELHNTRTQRHNHPNNPPSNPNAPGTQAAQHALTSRACRWSAC
jgi:hypothetical protein